MILLPCYLHCHPTLSPFYENKPLDCPSPSQYAPRPPACPAGRPLRGCWRPCCISWPGVAGWPSSGSASVRRPRSREGSGRPGRAGSWPSPGSRHPQPSAVGEGVGGGVITDQYTTSTRRELKHWNCRTGLRCLSFIPFRNTVFTMPPTIHFHF